MADSTRAARGTDDRRRLADGLVLQPGQVRVDATLPQLYGTQFTVTDRELGPRPIEDPQRLDERRAEAGLEPFADYVARMRART
jgi:hypothetical protein